MSVSVSVFISLCLYLSLIVCLPVCLPPPLSLSQSVCPPPLSLSVCLPPPPTSFSQSPSNHIPLQNHALFEIHLKGFVDRIPDFCRHYQCIRPIRFIFAKHAMRDSQPGFNNLEQRFDLFMYLLTSQLRGNIVRTAAVVGNCKMGSFRHVQCMKVNGIKLSKLLSWCFVSDWAQRTS